MKGLKEKKLLYKVVSKKDPEAYGQLYDIYVDKIYRFVYFKISNKEESEDIVSEAFLNAWNFLTNSTGKDTKSFNSLIYKISRNAIIDVYRDRARRNSNECSLELVGDVLDKNCIDKNLKNKEKTAELIGHLKKMKQEYHELILLRYIEEMSIKEIAQILEKKQTNVRVSLHRAMKILKKIIDS
jgi:RNA polymerase sigma-70 factor, ECF subfamily